MIWRKSLSITNEVIGNNGNVTVVCKTADSRVVETPKAGVWITRLEMIKCIPTGRTIWIAGLCLLASLTLMVATVASVSASQESGWHNKVIMAKDKKRKPKPPVIVLDPPDISGM